jgi:hypothetical protein
LKVNPFFPCALASSAACSIIVSNATSPETPYRKAIFESSNGRSLLGFRKIFDLSVRHADFDCASNADAAA